MSKKHTAAGRCPPSVETSSAKTTSLDARLLQAPCLSAQRLRASRSFTYSCIVEAGVSLLHRRPHCCSYFTFSGNLSSSRGASLGHELTRALKAPQRFLRAKYRMISYRKYPEMT